MTYFVDPELATIRESIPMGDFSDVTHVRELTRKFGKFVPPYESQRELSVLEQRIPGDVRVRVIEPAEARKPLPSLIYLHLGGYVTGDIETAENAARRIADEMDVAVITVDYRLAPENPYPAALDDSYAVLEWARDNLSDTIAILGDSAGGGLAVAAALRSRDRQGPCITALILDAPTIDDRHDTSSMREFTDTPMLRAVDLPNLWHHYLGSRSGVDDVPIYAAPGRASIDDLRGLPPTWIATYQLDPTRDSVLSFAGRLSQADVPTELRQYASAFHMAHTIPGTVISERMIADKHAAIRRMLAR